MHESIAGICDLPGAGWLLAQAAGELADEGQPADRSLADRLLERVVDEGRADQQRLRTTNTELIDGAYT